MINFVKFFLPLSILLLVFSNSNSKQKKKKKKNRKGRTEAATLWTRFVKDGHPFPWIHFIKIKFRQPRGGEAQCPSFEWKWKGVQTFLSGRLKRDVIGEGIGTTRRFLHASSSILLYLPFPSFPNIQRSRKGTTMLSPPRIIRCAGKRLSFFLRSWRHLEESWSYFSSVPA